MSTRLWRVPATLVATFALALTAVPAFGDNIRNDVGAAGDNDITLSGGTASTVIKFRVQDTGSNGCDVSTASPAVYSVTLTAPQSGANAAVTANPTSVSFNACAVEKSVTFTATSAGTKDVSLTRVSGPSLNENPAKFTLTVRAGVVNTAPQVSVAGVTHGASYEFGSVPAASCTVVDAEDSGESATPVLSAITGPLAAHGLGSRTATCSYTDAGGLSDTESATYSIVDTTDPILNTPGDQVLEATSPSGAEASWSISGSDNVALAAPASCDVASPHTFDLGTHTVTCSVTDVAGNSVQDSFTVTVSDTTAPGITAPNNQTVEATGPDGAVVTYLAPEVTDNYDTGLAASCTPESGSTFALGETTVNCSVTDTSDNTSSASFTVTVIDTTPPEVTVPDDISAEATGPGGAAVDFSVSATDLVDGALDATCDYTSGDTFPLGTTTVTCSSTDNAGNTGTETFDVVVVDTTPPVIDAHADVTAEATGPDGATVSYTDPGATDLVDGTVGVGCIPSSGILVSVGGSQLVTCTATDAAGNSAERTFTLYVVDTTPPTVAPHDDVTAEATGPSGASVSYTNPDATDIVDGAVTTDCTPASPVTVAVDGSQLVTCTATDAAGNTGTGTFTLNVVDTTPPTIDSHDDVTAEATGPSGASVSYTNPDATDIVDGAVTTDCTPASGVVVAVDGDELVTCTATDAAGNSATSNFTLYVVDTTAPTLSLPANITTTASSSAGAVVIYTATATDLVDGARPVTCSSPSGSTFAPGTTTVSCTSTDLHGNTSPAGTFTVTVSFAFRGFFAPVDNAPVVNTIRGGQSVPLKWAISNGSGGFIGDLAVVSSIRQTSITCAAGAPTDDIEAPTSGASVLRYDTTANQYIYNWQSPKGAGSCYKVTVNFTDGTSKFALFKTK